MNNTTSETPYFPFPSQIPSIEQKSFCRQDAQILEIHLICKLPLQQPCHWDVFPKKTLSMSKTEGWIWQNMTCTSWNMMDMMGLPIHLWNFKAQGIVMKTYIFFFKLLLKNNTPWTPDSTAAFTQSSEQWHVPSNESSRHWTSQNFQASFVGFMGSELSEFSSHKGCYHSTFEALHLCSTQYTNESL